MLILFRQFLLILAGLLLLNACSDNTQSWDEEVQLLDGRVIVVTQKRLLENGILTRDAWLTMTLPEFSAQPIVWHEALKPMILNIVNGKLYVVALPPTDRENRRYGKPKPPYIGYRWNGGVWDRIAFSEIPKTIYEANLLVSDVPNPSVHLLTLEQKNSREMNNAPGLPDDLKRVSPETSMYFD